MLAAKVENIKVVVINSGENEWNRTIEARVEGLTKKAYGWSKYGGERYGLVQSQKLPEWFCQACRETQTSELPSYMFEFSPGEFIRICSDCQFIKMRNQLSSLVELVSLVRKMDELW